MAGLIDTTTGLRYGAGLIWENGLGGAGLINPPSGSAPISAIILFNGVGSLQVAASQKLAALAVFAGAGSLAVNLFVLNRAIFNGVGSLLVNTAFGNAYITEDGTQDYVTENGTQTYVTE